MEVAGLVLGIVPLVVEVFSTWRIVHDRTLQFMTARTIVDDSVFRLKTQGLLFNREIRGLLDAVVVDRNEVESMLKDAQHPAWKDIDTRLSLLFGNHLLDDKEHYIELAGRIAHQLNQLRDNLPRLEDFDSPRRRVCLEIRLVEEAHV